MAAQRGVATDGVYVAYFNYGSPATRYGLWAGRRVVEVNETATPDLQAFIDAVKNIAGLVQKGRLTIDGIDEEAINRALYTRGLPDPDLLIRTSGEQRISNFLLWQLSYAEFYFTEKLWPDFNAKEFKKAIYDYQKRDRRYGKLAAKG